MKLKKQGKYNFEKIYGKDINVIILLIISTAFTIILFLIGVLSLAGFLFSSSDFLNGWDFIVFGILSAIGPIGFYNHMKTKKKREIENHLPDFLREISSSTSSGMTVFDAIISASRGDHGRLTPELQKMAAQLSWGISVPEALNNLAKRINTPAIHRMAVTINKALEIGGNTSVVFEAAAKEIDQIKIVEIQRKTEMSLYSMVIFISFFVFLAVIIIINKTIFEEMFTIQEKMPQGESLAGIAGDGFSFNVGMTRETLKNTFFGFILVQSLGGGLLGGFMMDGKLSSGVRFGFILILITFLIFKFIF
jgi:flagellar protein FlaJ